MPELLEEGIVELAGQYTVGFVAFVPAPDSQLLVYVVFHSVT